MTLIASLREWDEAMEEPSFLLPGLRSYAALYDYARYLSRTLYSDFERDLAPEVPPFLSRLEDWVLGASLKDQRKTLFELMFHVRFIARHEIHCLYQSAYRGTMVRWVIDDANIDLTGPYDDLLLDSLRRTWIGSSSESFHVDTFFHITGAPASVPRRPAWLDLAQFGTTDRVRDYLSANALSRVAIFEDFVGTGTQIKPAIEFASTLPASVPILVCPIFAAGESFETLAELISLPNITYEPLITLSAKNSVPELARDGEPSEYVAFRQCILDLHHKVADPVTALPRPFGFGKLGSLLVQYANTPDNSLPLLWHRSAEWTPLFPRKHRSGDS